MVRKESFSPFPSLMINQALPRSWLGFWLPSDRKIVPLSLRATNPENPGWRRCFRWCPSSTAISLSSNALLGRLESEWGELRFAKKSSKENMLSRKLWWHILVKLKDMLGNWAACIFVFRKSRQKHEQFIKCRIKNTLTLWNGQTFSKLHLWHNLSVFNFFPN